MDFERPYLDQNMIEDALTTFSDYRIQIDNIFQDEGYYFIEITVEDQDGSEYNCDIQLECYKNNISCNIDNGGSILEYNDSIDFYTNIFDDFISYLEDNDINVLEESEYMPKKFTGRILSEAEEEAIDADIATYDLNKVATSSESEQVISAMADAYKATHQDSDTAAYTQKVKDIINKTQANAELLNDYKKSE